ncbi:hypothetical protein JTB14_021781 [Gonioctena quinquepunctata]|nr:hypothetical protein JTB14_021781 [Gonioctena quinquepunctata]
MAAFAVALMFFLNIPEATTRSEECSPTYCDNKRFKCVAPNCTENEVEKTIPEKCQCCPICLTKLHEGEKCGNDPKSICADGLKCINNICTCAASYK